MQLTSWIEGTVGFLSAWFVGTLVEYIVHRLMHNRKFLHNRHMRHHKTNIGIGWIYEFRDYFFPTLPIMFLGFLFSLEAGIGFWAGGLFYACFAAYSHQVQHENPELVFWMKKPIHHFHHVHKMEHHNFGISVDIWDRVFRTYKDERWTPERNARDYPLTAFFNIHWIRPETQNHRSD